jgi:hypothetical protein
MVWLYRSPIPVGGRGAYRHPAKCHHLKKFTWDGTLQQVLIDFIDWRYSHSCYYFRPSFVNCYTSNLLSGSTLPPPPLFSLCGSVPSLHCIHVHRTVRWGGGGGGGGIGFSGPDTEKTCRKVPLQVNFFRWRHFALPSMSLIFLCYMDCLSRVSNPLIKWSQYLWLQTFFMSFFRS